MPQSKKNILLILLSAALLSLILLSSSLSHLQLHPGIPLPVVQPHNTVPAGEPHPDRIYSFTFLQAVLGLMLFLLMVYVPARLILYVRVRWLFRLVQILASLLLAALLFYFMRYDPGCPAAECSQPGVVPSADMPVLSFEGPPQNLLNAAGFGLIAAGVLLGSWFLVRLFRRPAVDPVLLHAEAAVQDMQAGKDFRNVIIQCYARMASALQKEHGIERDSSMTSREFEAYLASRGFPARPVHGLTVLFEKVRYSRSGLTRDDERQALDCLQAIIGHAEGKARG
ncbi:MAG: DUF4129 domain-containing protein [Syntrophothermus sp.]